MHKNKDFKLKLIFLRRFKFTGHRSSLFPFYYHFLPYGMGILTAFLRQHNYYLKQDDFLVRLNYSNGVLTPRFKNIDFELEDNRDEINSFLKSDDSEEKINLFIDEILDSISIDEFDLIGFSIFSSFNFIFPLLLSKRIKQRTNTPIVFGGAFITLYSQLYPDIFNFIDYMIIGDGRVPLLRLIDYLNNKIPISEVPNLIYRDNGKLIIHPRQHYPIEDMPTPDFDGLNLKLYKSPSLYRSTSSVYPVYNITLPYQISRGCTSRCSFCAHKYIDDKLEFKSYGKVLNELEQMKERYNSNIFHFCDDRINNSYEYLEGLCDLFIKNRLDIRWSAYAKIGNLDRRILRKIREAGCRWLSFGIESGSNSILKRIHKGFTAEQANRTLEDASELGFKTSICLIAGYPHETQDDIEQTIDFIRKNKKYVHYPNNIRRFSLTYGSQIYYYPEKYGVTNLTPLQFPFLFCL